MSLETIIAELVPTVGFPIAAFVAMLYLYINGVKKFQDIQEKGDLRYENLVKCFVENIKAITDEHNKALNGLATSLEAHIREKDKLIAKHDDIIQMLKEERMNHRS